MRSVRLSFALSLVLSLVLGGSAHAQSRKPAAGKKAPAAAGAPVSVTPEVLGAQAFLEDLLVRRYSQELGTRVDRQAFSLGAQLELMEAPKLVEPPAADDPTPSDLLLGTIDPDAILKKYAGPEERRIMAAFLNNYRIRSVSFSVGLKDHLGPEVKAQVEDWLKGRLKSEFNTAGKGQVYFIRQESGKSLMDWLSQFQGLAGQLILAAAILLGLLLWKGAGSGRAEAAQPVGATTAPAASVSAEEEQEEEGSGEPENTEDLNPAPALREIKQLTKRINGLIPKLGDSLEPVVRTWSTGGDEGRLKVACFAEAVDTGLGKLPIPADAMAEVSKVFANMPDLGVRERRDTLRKAYWDLMKAINLGSDSIEEPFGYLGSLNVDMVNQVLMDQNSKMKTLVTFHMPSTLRESFMKSLDADAKRELILQAANLTEIAKSELKSFDGMIKGKLGAGGGQDIVKLPSALEKVVSGLSPIEEVSLLASMEGPTFESYKRTIPSLAFLGQWPDDKLQLLFSEAMPTEVVALLRVRGDLKDRVIKSCAPMTARIASDELVQEDRMKDAEKNDLLNLLLDRIRRMVSNKELDLEALFVTQGSESESKQAA